MSQETIGEKPTVFFDGACPLCAREIAFYRRRVGSENIEWVDVSRSSDEGEVAPGLRREQLLARFHVQTVDGRIVSGGAAFTALWSALPRFRWVGKLFRLPPLASLLDRLYELFLHLRPHLQAILSRRSS
ncbi:MAG: thiol-disulfide oxidoreductase DCC family protein [Gammaproteobacteria bacterium]